MIAPKPLRKNQSSQMQRPRRKHTVTVCVAAIAERSTLVGVSDRMLTAGDVEFEPAQAKIWAFSRSIFALIAGDFTTQAEILSVVDIEIKRRIDAQPDEWIAVKEVAQLYCKRYRELLRERAEAEILSPLGLDFSTFFARQSEMHPDVISDITEKLTDYDFDSPLATLFIGNDHDGPDEKLTYVHLYATEGDKLLNYTTVGFAAIGIGKFHAESEFMFSGHWPSKPFHETLLLAYAAKKRAEVAPGVGKDTDMIVVGPGLGVSLKVEDRHIEGLEKIYQKGQGLNKKTVGSSFNETERFVSRVRKEYETKAKKDAPNPQSVPKRVIKSSAPKKSDPGKSEDRQ